MSRHQVRVSVLCHRVRFNDDVINWDCEDSSRGGEFLDSP